MSSYVSLIELSIIVLFLRFHDSFHQVYLWKCSLALLKAFKSRRRAVFTRKCVVTEERDQLPDLVANTIFVEPTLARRAQQLTNVQVSFLPTVTGTFHPITKIRTLVRQNFQQYRVL